MNLSFFRVEKETFAQTKSFSSLKLGSTLLTLFILVLFSPVKLSAQHSPNGLIDPEIIESKRKESVSVVYSKFLKSNYTVTPATDKVFRGSAGDVVINEIVTDPQIDWETNDFDGTDGGVGVTSGTDEWVELYIKTAGLDLTGWTIELNDGTDVVGDLTSSGAFQTSNYLSSGSGTFTSTEAGDYVVLGNVASSSQMSNSITIILKDASSNIIDQVTLGGGAGEAPSGNASSTLDESVQRVPNGSDTDTDNVDFVQGVATLGGSNSEENSDPTFTSTPITSIAENVPYSYTVEATDADGDAITYSAPTLPSWLSAGLGEYQVGFVAGSEIGSIGLDNGTGADARFAYLKDIEIDADGNFIIAEYSIRKMTPAGVVTSLTSWADRANGIAIGADGTIYFSGNGHQIYKIESDGSAVALAGTLNSAGYVDATGTSAKFYSPVGMDIGSDGNIYVADRANGVIRKVTTSGVVTTYAGDGSFNSTNSTNPLEASFKLPWDVEFDNQGNLYVVDEERIAKIDGETGAVTTFTNYVSINDIVKSINIDSQGNLYASSDYRLYKIDSDGTFTIIAGSGISAYVNGSGSEARFKQISGFDLDAQGNLYVTDQGHNAIRKVSAPDYIVSGNPSGQVGNHSVTVKVTDSNGNNTSQSFSISVLQVPVFTSETSVNVNEGTTSTVYTAVATDNSSVTYSLGSGNDEALFSIDSSTGELTFKSAPDYENASDIDSNNSYVVNVIATDTDAYSSNQDVTINVLDVDEVAPTVITIVRQDPSDQNTFNTSVTFRVVFDEAVNNVSTADFQLVGDASGGTAAISDVVQQDTKRYDITVNNISIGGDLSLSFASGHDIVDVTGNAFEGTISSNSSYTITINTLPVFDSSPVTSVLDINEYEYRVSASDADGHSISLSATTLPSWLNAANETDYQVISIAGEEDANSTTDGTGLDARFYIPSSLTMDNDGNLLIGQFRAIRKMTPAGVVTTFHSGTDLNTVVSIEAAADGTIYFANSKSEIYKIPNEGSPSLLAGASDARDWLDGTGASAKFNQPEGIAIGPNGNVYIADTYNHRIRKVTPEGVVTTIAGDGVQSSTNSYNPLWASLELPKDIAVDSDGNIYVTTGRRIAKIRASDNNVITFNNDNLEFEHIEISPRGELYVSTTGRKVYKVSAEGVLTHIAGTGTTSTVNGNGLEASFPYIAGLTVDKFGDLYVVHSGLLREIEEPRFKLSGNAIGNDGEHNIVITATDEVGGIATQNYTLTVNDSPPVFTSNTTSSSNEGVTSTNYIAEATDPTTITYSLGSGNDESLFNIDPNSGALTFKSAPDFENPEDSNTDNNYVVNIVATDANSNSVNQNVTISVQNVDEESPVVNSIVRQNPSGTIAYTSATFRVTFDENVSNISIADFAISGTGAGGTATLSGFTEVTASTVFDLTVTNINTIGELDLDIASGQDISDVLGNAYDGTINSEETYTIAINSDPTFTSTPVTSVNSNVTYLYAVSTNDGDGHSVTITGTTLPDWLSASLNSEYEVSTIAGPGDGTPGTTNGTGSDARFDDLKDIALDNDGNLIIAEQAIRKMTPQGVVTAVTSTDFANVWNATGITVADDGTIYFSSTNDQIFKHTTEGLTSAIAGASNNEGYSNGTGTVQTRFYNPGGMDMGPDGNIYVADTWNSRIRKVTPDGVVTTFAGDGEEASTENADPLLASIEYPVDLVFDASGNMFITTGSRIARIDAGTGALTTFAASTGTSGLFQGLTIDTQGNLFSTTNYRKVYKIDTDGNLTKIAGTGGVAVVDGPGSTAVFTKIDGLAVDGNGDVYIAGENSRSIRKVAAPGFKVTGDPSGQIGDHSVILTATDDFGGSATQSFTITVNDITDPVFTSGTSVSVDEGTSATIYTAAATDESILTFSLGSGNDESLFNIDASTGELTFKSAPDFEDPLDGNTDNDYVVNIVVTDTGGNTVNQDVTITVDDIDEVAPQMTGVSQNSTTTLNVIFDEAVQVLGSNPTDFIVKDDNNNAFAVSAIADGTPGDTQITLTLADFSTASGDLTVTYTNNNNEVTDLVGNALATNSTGVSFDEIGPAIAQDIRLGLDANSNQVDITFSEGVFGTNGGSGSVEVSDFSVALSNNSTVDTPVITSITNTSDGALTGGETTLRFNFSYNGTARGDENLTFTPVADAVFDISGNAASTTQSNNVLQLHDETDPTITGITLAEASGSHNVDLAYYIDVEFSEGVYGATFDDFDLDVVNSATVILHTATQTNGDALVGGETTIRLNVTLNTYGTSEGSAINVTVNAESIFDQANNDVPLFDQATTETIDQTLPAVVALFVDAANSVLTVYFNEAIYADNGASLPIEASDLSLSVSEGSATDVSITNLFGQLDADLTGGESQVRVHFSLTGTPNGEEKLTINATNNSSIFDGSGNSMVSPQLSNNHAFINDIYAPVFSSGTSINFVENGEGTVYTAVATDIGTVTYSLANSNDEAFFNIDGSTGVVSFKVAPDFENAEDADSNNDYVIGVIATDDQDNASELELTISVTDSDEIAPLFISASTASYAENGEGTVYIAIATDGGNVTYSLADANDEEFFNIDSSTGELTFKVAPDFEAPQDVDLNNSYVLIVKATDGESNESTLEVTVTVTDLDENAPVFTSASTASYVENGEGTVYTAIATDVGTVTYSLANSNDEEFFSLNASTGVLTFIAPPDFENPLDADGNNSYVLVLKANDDSANESTLELAVTVTDLDEEAPVFTSLTTVSFDENAFGTVYTATVSDSESETITFTLGSDKDESAFSIDGSTGVLTFVSPPDFENPSSESGSNNYEIDIKATDQANNESTLTLIISVNDLDEVAPVFTSSSSASFAENDEGTIYTAVATDDGVITYSLGDSNDEEFFNLDGSNGQLTFKAAPDFESPQDADFNNSYVLVLMATDDSGNESTLELTVTVTSQNEDPVITSNPITEIDDDQIYTYQVTTTDPDGDNVIVTSNALPSWLSLYGENGVVTFAGNGQSGSTNANLLSSSFNIPIAVAEDSQGNLYVADLFNHTIRRISTNGQVTTFAGTGSAGSQDGTGTEASFNEPSDLAIDSQDNIFVVDRENDAIRKITPTGVVTYFVGGTEGYQDGTGTAAWFDRPTQIAIDDNDNLFITDQNNFRIRKITSAGVVTTIAGSGVNGFQDGDSGTAQFSQLTGIGVDGEGNVYVSDYDNRRIRKIDIAGNVTTLAGSDTRSVEDGLGSQASFYSPLGIDVDEFGNVYVAEDARVIRKIEPSGQVTTIAGAAFDTGTDDGAGVEAKFTAPNNVFIDTDGNLFITEGLVHLIRKVVINGSLLTGNASGQSESASITLTADDGNGGIDQQSFTITINDVTAPVFTSEESASFTENASGTVYTAVATDVGSITYSLGTSVDEEFFSIDSNTGEITFLSTPDFEIPLDGDANNSYVLIVKATDAATNESTLELMVTVTDVDEDRPVFTSEETASFTENASGTVYTAVAEDESAIIYSLGTSVDEEYFTIDSSSGEIAFLSTPDFETPLDGDGDNSYVLIVKATDNEGNESTLELLISIIDLNEEPIISSSPITTINSSEEYVYTIEVSDPDDDPVQLEMTQGPSWLKLQRTYTNVETFAGSGNAANVNGQGVNASFGSVGDIAIDNNDNVFVGVSAAHVLKKIDKEGNVTTYAGILGVGGSVDGSLEEATFGHFTAMTFDRDGNLFIVDGSERKIRKISTEGLVTTVAGSGVDAVVNGSASEAAFSSPVDIAVDSHGNIFIAETNDHTIRKIDTDGNVSTFAGSGLSGFVNANGADAYFNSPTSLVIDSEDNLYVTDISNFHIRKITPQGEVTSYVGKRAFGNVDAQGENAVFNSPYRLAIDSDDNLYVTELLDFFPPTIRKVDTEQNVTTIAGSTEGYLDGAALEAQFGRTLPLDIDSRGRIYIADEDNYRVRRVNSVITLTGNPEGQVGDYNISLSASDGNGAQAIQAFTLIVTDNESPAFTSASTASFSENNEGTVYTAVATDAGTITYSLGTSVDEEYFTIDSSTGVISFLSAPDFETPLDGDADNSYVLIVKATDNEGNESALELMVMVTDVDEDRPVFTSAETTSFTENADGIVYTAVATDAGTITYSLGTSVDKEYFTIDSNSGEITFLSTPDFETPLDGDTDNNYLLIVKATDNEGNESTLELSVIVTNGNEDPRFFSSPITEINDNTTYQYEIITSDPDGDILSLSATTSVNWLSIVQAEVSSLDGLGLHIEKDTNGNFYVIDGNQIKKIDVAGNVTVLAGQLSSGSVDGTGTNASFYLPEDLEFGPDGNLYVADTRNSLIRKVTLDGVVTTFAGKLNQGFTVLNGPSLDASFVWPTGLAFDGSGNLFVADSRSQLIRKITSDGIVSTFAGSNTPISIDRGNGPSIIDLDGGYADGIGSVAKFDGPKKLDFDSYGNIYVTDQYNHLIRKINPEGDVTTFAGESQGFSDGVGSNALFDNPIGIVVDSNDRIFVTSSGRVRLISLQGNVSTIAGSGNSGFQDGPGPNALFESMIDIISSSNNELIIPDFTNRKLRKIRLTQILIGETSGHVGTHQVSLSADDGNGGLAQQSFSITVNDVTPPEFTSSQIIESLENSINTQYIATAIDSNPNAVITYSLGNANDESYFTIDSSTGEITFLSAPDFENPLDVDANNSYVLIVKATDSEGNESTLELMVTVTNVDEDRPVFTSGTTASFDENASGVVYTATVTDENSITFSLGTSKDESAFTINSGTGVLTFISPPDFESPASQTGSNNYLVDIKATDGSSNETILTLTVTVNDVDEDDPVFTSASSVSFTENSEGTVYTAEATDAGTISYGLADSNDEELFTIDGSTGELTFKSAPDFERPQGADLNNTYVLVIKATDEVGNTSTLELTVTVTDVDDDVLEGSLSINDVTRAENADAGSTTAFIFTVTLSDNVGSAFTVDYGTGDNTATTAGSDYNSISGTLNFAGTAGETQQIIVTVNNDDILEGDETFGVQLVNLQANGQSITITDDTGIGTITNDDQSTLSISDVTKVEGNSGTTDFTFAVTMSGAVDQQVTIDYATSDGTATIANGDYNSTSGTLTFSGADRQSQIITVGVNGDNIEESNESFTVSLSNIQDGGKGASFAKSTAVATIGNDDDNMAPSGFSVSFDDQSIGGNEVSSSTFTFSGAEVGTVYNYSITSAGGGTTVTGSGTIATAADQISIPDLSGLNDGLLTLSATLTDGSSNISNSQKSTTTLDKTGPIPAITSSSSGLIFTKTITATVTFNEEVTGFTIDDLSATNSVLSNFTGSGTTYTVLMTASADGEMTLTVPVEVAEDGLGNKNTVSNTLLTKVEAFNAAPSGLALSDKTITEKLPVGTVIGAFSTTDPDDNDRHQYSLIAGEGGINNNLFQIVDNQLITKEVLNFQNIQTANIRVRTTDLRGSSFEKSFDIEVINQPEPRALVRFIYPSGYATYRHDFGRLFVGQEASVSLQISNVGVDGDLNVSDIKLPDGYEASETEFVVAQGETQKIEVKFSPKESKYFSGYGQVISNGGTPQFQISGYGLINQPPVAFDFPLRSIELSDRVVTLSGYDPERSSIEFVITQSPQKGSFIDATTSSDRRSKRFLPQAGLTPGRYKDEFKFKVREVATGVESEEASGEFYFEIQDTKHEINDIRIIERTEDHITLDLTFTDETVNSSYYFALRTFESYYSSFGSRFRYSWNLFYQNNFSHSQIETESSILKHRFQLTGSAMQKLISKSQVWVNLQLRDDRGLSQSFYIKITNDESGTKINVVNEGTEDGEFVVFGEDKSLPENETVDVDLSALEFGGFDLEGATIEISDNPLYGTVGEPSLVENSGEFARWRVSYTSTSETQQVDSIGFIVSHPARDEQFKAFARLEIIEVPDQPVLSSIDDQQIQEDESLSLKLDYSDPDSELSVSVTSTDSDNVSLQVVDGTLSVIPNQNYNGNVEILVTVTEADSNDPTSVLETFNLQILPVNDQPIMSAITDTQVNEDNSIELKLQATDADEELATFEFTATTDQPENVEISIEADVMTIMPVADFNGDLTFYVKADDGEGTLSSVSEAETFVLKVNPVNDSPEVSRTIATQSIVEGLPAYTIDLSDYFSDPDIESNELTYTVGSVSNVSLTVNGSILTIQSVDGAEGLETVTITASDGVLSASQDVNFIASASSDKITVANALSDMNLEEDFDLQVIDISELFAYSSDANAVFTYQLSGNNSVSAAISGTSLEIGALENFNGSDQLYIIGSTDGISAYTQININVSAVNDAPQLVSSISDLSVLEDVAVSRVISNNIFSDVDGDALTYSASFDAAWLSFDAATRTFSGTPENKDVGTIEVTLTAEDPSGAKATDTFQIVVSNTNDDPTDIGISATAFDENISLGTAVATLSGTDPDLGDASFTYSLVSGTGDTDNSSFEIVDGQLKTLTSINFEAKTSYSIRVKIMDGFEGSFEKVFVISVNDVNEAATDIALATTFLSENQSPGSVINGFATTDPDSDDTHIYSLVAGEGDTDNDSFEIIGGGMASKVKFNFEEKSSYSVRVRAIDAGGLTFEKTFTINISDANDAPTGITSDNLTLAENESIGTKVGTLSTTDEDASDSYTYQLVAGNGDTDNSLFGLESGKLVSKGSFNFETKSSYSVRVKSTDKGGLSVEEALTITISDANDAPTAVNSTSLEIAENEGIGAVIGQFTSIDEDSSDEHTYSLISGEGGADNDSFEFDGWNLKAKSSFNFETKSSYSIRVQSSDGKGGILASQFTVNVTNVLEVELKTESSVTVPTIGVGETETAELVLNNDGEDELEITNITFPEGYSGSFTSVNIAAGSSETLTITFEPTEVGTYAGDITITSNAGTNVVSITGEAEVVAGIEDPMILPSQVKLYPNPASQFVEIDLTDLNGIPADLSIKSIGGADLWNKKKVRESKVLVDISNYADGAYLILVQTDRGTVTKRLLIRK